jgi:hypothetical protein
MKRTVISGAIALAILGPGSVATRADPIYDLSFTKTTGNVAGTVTGTIDLPFSGDRSGAATHVIINSSPFALGTNPLDATTWVGHENNNSVVSGRSAAHTGTVFEAHGKGLVPGPKAESEPVMCYATICQPGVLKDEVLGRNPGPDSASFTLLPLTGDLDDTKAGNLAQGLATGTALIALHGVSIFTFGACQVWRRRASQTRG